MTTGAPVPWRRVISTCCTTVLLCVGALVAVRGLGLDAGTLLSLPVAAMPYALPVAVGALLLLLSLRAWPRVLLAVALVAVQLLWLAPRYTAGGTGVPPGASLLRLGTANTYQGQIDARALVDLVARERLDVLALQELTPGVVARLDEAGLQELLPHRELRPGADTALFSRLPLRGGSVLEEPTVWPQATAEVRVGGRTVHLVSVHTYFPAGPDRWTRDLRALRSGALEDTQASVLLGDFNATLDHAPMRELLGAGLVDTHVELGRGGARTWPVTGGAVPPLIHLDHVLHGRDLVGVSVEDLVVPGTDHKVVVAELAVPRG